MKTPLKRREIGRLFGHQCKRLLNGARTGLRMRGWGDDRTAKTRRVPSERTVVKRMAPSNSAEIEAHNAAVDAKKSAKKAMKELK
jgi:hypothetical protein